MKSTNLKYLFAFEGDESFLLEIKNLDIPSTMPKDSRLHWLLIPKNGESARKLKFQSMGTDEIGEYRNFEEGTLRFSREGADLQMLEGCTLKFAQLNEPQNNLSIRRSLKAFLASP